MSKYVIGDRIVINEPHNFYRGKTAIVTDVATFDNNIVVYTVNMPHGDNAKVSFAVREQFCERAA